MSLLMTPIAVFSVGANYSSFRKSWIEVQVDVAWRLAVTMLQVDSKALSVMWNHTLNLNHATWRWAVFKRGSEWNVL